MEVSCPKCSSRQLLTAADLASRERLRAFRCDGCGVDFDARQQLAQQPRQPSLPVQNGTAKPPVRTGAAKPKAASSALLRTIPVAIGQYEIIEEINRGGMGIVYKAIDTVLKRKVAIKVLLAGEGATETDIKRFQREAEATARLQHPNIVPIYAIGTFDGKPYFVMDFIEGKTAKQLMERGEMTPRLALKIIAGVSDALHHAHIHGVFHRDVKPANIIVNLDEIPQLMDFGLARRADEDLEITQSGTTMGTPSYMPPEQAEGKLDEVDERSDVYSAGACLYELLTGRVPFEGATTLSVLRKIIEDPPVPPRKLHPAIHRDVETICLKCLEKKKSGRYPTALELAREIRRFEAGEAITARPLSLPHALWRKLRRHRELSIAALIMVLSGLGVIVYAVSESRRAALHEKEERADRYRALLSDGQEALEQSRTALRSGDSDSDAGFDRDLVKLKAGLAKAGSSFQMAQALAGDSAEVKLGLEQIRKVETQAEVRRYILKAHSFLHPLPATPGAEPPPPNFGAAAFAAQEAADRDPQNVQAHALLREALGMRRIWIALAGPDPAAAPVEIFARKFIDAQGRTLAAANSDAGISLGTAPISGVELEPGCYVITFKQKSSGRQQATLRVDRDSTDAELTLSFPNPGREENMASISDGGSAPAFYIDRYEFPNRPGTDPLVGASLLEARQHCAQQGKTLCSRAQWSRACAGPQGNRFPYGNQYAGGTCATGLDSNAQTHPFLSGQFTRCRTAEGVYDMAGNAAEWVENGSETVMGGDWTASNQTPDLSGSCLTAVPGEDSNKDRRGFRCCKAAR